MIAQAGKLLVTGPRFSYADWHVTHAVVDIDLIRMSRARTASYRPTISTSHDETISAAFDFPKLKPKREVATHPAWETSPHIKEEEFTRAESLALFDYLRKSRSSGFVVSLSGGADSTAVSYLVARLVEFAAADIGRECLLKKLSYIRRLDQAKDNKQLVRRLLAWVSQPTRNSGHVTQ